MLELKGLTDTEYNIIKSPFELVMITLTANDGEQPGPDELESAMYYMEQSIRQTIRNVDVFTRYNHRCFLVVLIGADSEGVKIAVDRIFRGYYKMIGSSVYFPSCSVSEICDSGQPLHSGLLHEAETSGHT